MACRRSLDDSRHHRDAALGMKRFILLLRQLASEFDAFGGTPEGRAVFAELEAIRLPLELRAVRDAQRTVAAGSFLALASRVLLERDPAVTPPEMPMSWPSLDTRGARPAGQRVVARPSPERFADMKRQPGRFDEPGAQYAAARLRPAEAGWRLPGAHRMERLQRAVRHRAVVRRRRRAASADPAAGRDRPRPAAVAQAERRLRGAAGAAEPAPRESEGSDGGEGVGRRLVRRSDGSAASACRSSRSARSSCLNIFLSLFDLDLPVDVLHQDLHPVPETRVRGDG